MVDAGSNAEFMAKKDHEDGSALGVGGTMVQTYMGTFSSLKSEKGSGMELRKVMEQSRAVCQDMVGLGSGK